MKVKVLRSCTWRLTFGESVAERKGGDADWAEGVCFKSEPGRRERLATCYLLSGPCDSTTHHPGRSVLCPPSVAFMDRSIGQSLLNGPSASRTRTVRLVRWATGQLTVTTTGLALQVLFVSPRHTTGCSQLPWALMGPRYRCQLMRVID